jgi:hypothetical protein
MAASVTTPIRRTTPAPAAVPDCSCGQALDCCHAHHCPRCGVTLQAA